MKNRVWIPHAIVTVLLVIAIARKNPYDYYTLLRWVCSFAFIYLAYVATKQQKTDWVWVFVCLLVLYNPIFKIALKRETWE